MALTDSSRCRLASLTLVVLTSWLFGACLPEPPRRNAEQRGPGKPRVSRAEHKPGAAGRGTPMPPAPRTEDSPVIRAAAPDPAANGLGAPPPQQRCPKTSYAKEDLTERNFANLDCSGVDFRGATLDGAIFTGANLSQARFDGASMKKTARATADFSNTTLRSASFQGAIFEQAVFQFADISCADFSNTSVHEAVFGARLTIQEDTTTCRTRFHDVKMPCAFVSQWKLLDLERADLTGCVAEMRAWKDFSDARMVDARITSGTGEPADLSGTTWQHAVLTGASMSNAVLTGAHFEHATLTGASLNYVDAADAVFDDAVLTADDELRPPRPAARMSYSYLVGASFGGSNLDYVDFTGSDLSAKPGVAGALGLSLIGTVLESANLSGRNLTGLVAKGAVMTNANLANTNLTSVDLGPNTFITDGKTTYLSARLNGAFLCGATLDGTILECANLSNAFIAMRKQTVQGPDGPTTCDETVLNPKMGSAEGSLNCRVSCPNGTPGPCSGVQWSRGATPAPPPCCTAHPGDIRPCPPRKRKGFPCTTDCDCVSRACASGTCE